MGGITLFHSHGATAATDISRKSKKLLYGNKSDVLISGSSCCFLQIQFAANGNAKHVNSGFRSTNYQGFINLLRWKTDGISCVHSIEIIFVEFIECFLEGDFCLLEYSNCVCFGSHFNHQWYYTTFFRYFQECIVSSFGYPKTC